MIIRHRAKTTSGKWVEGYPYEVKDRKYDLMHITTREVVQVESDTIEPILPECEWEYLPNSARDYVTTCGYNPDLYDGHNKPSISYTFCPNCGGKIKENKE